MSVSLTNVPVQSRWQGAASSQFLQQAVDGAQQFPEVALILAILELQGGQSLVLSLQADQRPVELGVLAVAVPAGGQEGAQRLQHLFSGIMLREGQEVCDDLAPALLPQAWQEEHLAVLLQLLRGGLLGQLGLLLSKHLLSAWPGTRDGVGGEKTQRAVRSAARVGRHVAHHPSTRSSFWASKAQHGRRPADSPTRPPIGPFVCPSIHSSKTTVQYT